MKLPLIRNNQRLCQLLRSGLLGSAFRLFEEMPDRDVVSYNTMIGGCVRLGYPQSGLGLFKEMIGLGIKETAQTFPLLFSAFSHREGLQLHCRVISLGFCCSPYVASALIHFYMRNGLPGLALRVFRELPQWTTAVCNSVLCGFCNIGMTEQLLQLFLEMKSDGLLNALSFSYAIHGCCYGEWIKEGKQLHCHIVKAGWVQSNIFLSNALVDLYSISGNLIDASKSIDYIPGEDVISWNSIVAAYADNGLQAEALEYFHRMLWYRKKPSIRSFVGFLNLSSRTGNLLLGAQIHGFVVKTSDAFGSAYVQSALIDMYGKCLDFDSSMLFFNELVGTRSLECYNSMITSLLHCNSYEDAIQIFNMIMVDEGAARPDHVTLSATIKALASSSLASASLDSCLMIHCYTIKLGYISDMAVSCSLINAYARSGCIDLSSQIFQDIHDPNLICFSALITAYARNGMGRESLGMLDKMINSRLKPDSITFVSVLAGCDHSGLVEEGKLLFESMKEVHGIEPDSRHYSCMVTLLGKAGLLEEATDLLKRVGLSDPHMWSSLLHNCRVHGNEEIGKRASQALMELEPMAAAVYLQVSSFYSEIADLEGSAQVREAMRLQGLRREMGCSSVEAKASKL